MYILTDRRQCSESILTLGLTQRTPAPYTIFGIFLMGVVQCQCSVASASPWCSGHTFCHCRHQVPSLPTLQWTKLLFVLLSDSLHIFSLNKWKKRMFYSFSFRMLLFAARVYAFLSSVLSREKVRSMIPSLVLLLVTRIERSAK